MTDKQQRAWVDEHAIAFALGMLDDEEERRFLEAIQNDVEFAELASARDSESIGHIPAALIARWDAAGRVLDENEFHLLEQHAHDCVSCREELELLAHGVLETSGISRHTGGIDWRSWLGGIVLGAAAMFALIMITHPSLPGLPSPITRTPGPSNSKLQGKIIDVVTPQAMRGTNPEPIRLSADATVFLLAVNLPTDVAAGATATIVVFDASSSILSRTTLGPAPWIPPSTQILILGDPHFDVGEYRVELRVEGESAVRSLGRFSIEVER